MRVVEEDEESMPVVERYCREFGRNIAEKRADSMYRRLDFTLDFKSVTRTLTDDEIIDTFRMILGDTNDR